MPGYLAGVLVLHRLGYIDETIERVEGPDAYEVNACESIIFNEVVHKHVIQSLSAVDLAQIFSGLVINDALKKRRCSRYI